MSKLRNFINKIATRLNIVVTIWKDSLEELVSVFVRESVLLHVASFITSDVSKSN